MASVNQTRPHCVNQMGKTHSKPLAARHGRGAAWARHGNGMLCVNRPLVGQTLTLEPLVLHTLVPETLNKSKPFSRHCTAVLSVMLPANFGSNLGRVFVTNLITFCTLFLFSVLLSILCAGYVYLCTMAFVCSISNWPCQLKPASQ